MAWDGAGTLAWDRIRRRSWRRTRSAGTRLHSREGGRQYSRVRYMGRHSGRDVSICHFGVLSSWLSRAGLDEILLSYEVEVAYEEM